MRWPRGRSASWVTVGMIALLALGIAVTVMTRQAGDTAPVARGSRTTGGAEAAVILLPLESPVGASVGATVASAPVMPLTGSGPSFDPSRFAHLAGRLLRGETPVARAEIRLHRLRCGPTDGALPAIERAVTGADGRFEADLLPHCEYGIDAMLGDERTAPIDPLATSPGSQHEITLQLMTLPWVDGVVVDADGRPVPGAWVELSHEAPPTIAFLGTRMEGRMRARRIQVNTDDEGRFEILVPTMGPATISADSVELPPSDPVGINFSTEQPHITMTLRLDRAAFISGHVHTSHGRPFIGLSVRAVPVDARPPSEQSHRDDAISDGVAVGMAVTYVGDMAGSFRLGPLHPTGVFDVEFWRDGENAPALKLSGVAAGTSDLGIVLDAAER